MAKSVSSACQGHTNITTTDTGSLQIVYKHYQRILAQWPVDLLRPNISFQTTIQRRVDTRLKPSTTPPQDNIVSNQAQATVPTPMPFDEKGELDQVNVLYSFLENRYTKKVCVFQHSTELTLTHFGQYPLSEKMMRPASNPDYYTNLVAELDAAPRRSWLQSKIHKWKGALRFS